MVLAVPPRIPKETLYQAQKLAYASVPRGLFCRYACTCFSSRYIETTRREFQGVLKAYNGILKGAYVVTRGLNQIENRIAQIANQHFGERSQIGRAIAPALNFIAPVNPVNGSRQFSLIPRFLEDLLGSAMFWWEGAQVGQRDEQRDVLRVEGVMRELIQRNEDLLHPQSGFRFDYEVKVVHSGVVNAFCYPGGKIVVTTAMIAAIQRAVRQIETTTISFADGTSLAIDLRGVTEEDVLAALLGHEATHAASRHTALRITKIIILTVFFEVLKYIINRIESREAQRAAGLIRHFDEKSLFFKLKQLAESRSDEYEADITGIRMSTQAGRNPLGALMLQELLSRDQRWPWFARVTEFLRTHPLGMHRKRAALTAIAQMAPDSLAGRARVRNLVNRVDFDPRNCDPAYRTANQIRRIVAPRMGLLPAVAA